MTAHLEVNEAKVFATRSGGEWWLLFRGRFEPSGRITVLVASIGGDRVAVACEDTLHARQLAGTMVEHGIPASALKVKNGAARAPAPVR